MKCSPHDHIGKVAEQMRANSFSQVPVYHEARLIAVLTTDTIARWVAHTLEKNGGILEEAPVKEVLKQAEVADNYKLLDPCATVIDALECFDDFLRQGRRLDAVIIAKNAKRESSPLGIISIADVPKLHRDLR